MLCHRVRRHPSVHSGRIAVAAAFAWLASLGICTQARAQTWQPPPAPSARPAPPPAKGFQLAVRTGWTWPFGSASAASGDNLASRYSSQFPLILDLGFKPKNWLLLGVYMGFSLGTDGNDARVSGLCNDRDNDLNNDISCSSGSLRAGLQAQFHVSADARWNPWFGYGIGYEAAWQTIRDTPRGRTESTTASGMEVARLSSGLDCRMTRVLGIGPFAELALGRFTSTRTDVNNETRYDGPIPDRAAHVWLTVGLRTVLFP